MSGTVQLPLPAWDFQILVAVLDEARHGYAIVQWIRDQTGTPDALGTSTLYAALKRLSRQGLIAEAPRPAGETSADERRRYYRATAEGRAVARAEARRIHQLHGLAEHARLLSGPARLAKGRS
ncbi:MAG: PadR family transcriptional regulator [Vicinamibacterales bacterium]